MKGIVFSAIRHEFPFGFVAAGLALILFGMCVYLPFEIYIGGGVAYISTWGITWIVGGSLLGIFASARALLNPNSLQKLLGIAAAVFSAVILTLSVIRVLNHFPN